MIRFDMSFDSNSNVFNYCLCWISINIVYKKKGKIPKKQSQVQDKPYKKKNTMKRHIPVTVYEILRTKTKD